MKLFVIIILHILFYFIKCQPHKLYEHIYQRYRFFSTATAYKYVSPVTPYPEPDCEVLQIWMMSKNGTRHPDDYENIAGLNEYRSINTEKSTLNIEDIMVIDSKESNLTVYNAGMLNEQGIEDMTYSATNLRTLYTKIFSNGYSSQDFRVISSPEKRCLDSASIFLNNAFDTDVDRKDILEMQKEDNRFNLYNRVNKETTKYEKDFIESPEIKEILDSVSKALGLDKTLKFEIIHTIYDACRYEKASRVNFNSSWCTAFSDRHLEVLEYYNDLKYYYSHGYGYQKTESLSKEIMADLIKHFRDKSQDNTGPKGVFYFGHSSNVFSVIVGLGFARDEDHLTDSNFEYMEDRKWRTSYLTPFSANVRAVLYQCEDGLKVTFFINDVPMYVEKHDCTLCPWKLIEKMLDPNSK